MKKIQILLGVCIIFSSQVMVAAAPEVNSARQEEVQADPAFVKSIEEALSAVKTESPQVHEDALRVWKNYKPKLKAPNFTYQYWGIRLILWLKDEKKIDFEGEKSDQKVRDVFTVLWQKKLISKEAVDVLTFYAWAHLLSLHGLPSGMMDKQRSN